MKIAMLGSGGVGKALAVAFAGAGHDVVIGTRSPDGEELRGWSEGRGVGLAEVGVAAAHGEVAVLATAWGGAQNALALAGGSLDGKVLVDVTNPLQFTDRLGLAIGHTDSGGEQVQRWAPAAKVVKAFNTVGFELMDHPRTAIGAPTLFVATDHDDARSVATALAADLGWSVHDCGGLRGARLTEPMALLWIEHAIRSGTRTHVLTLVTAES